MKRIAVCLKPQQLNYAEGYSIWRHFPLGIVGIKTLNYTMSILPNENIEIIAFIMAPMNYLDKMSKLYFWGFTKIVFISDTHIAGADSFGTAKVLSKAISQYSCDIVIAGKNSEDSCTGQVPMQIAMALNANYYLDKTIDFQTVLKRGKAVIAVERNYPEKFPDLLTIQKGINKIADIVTLQDLELSGQKLQYTDVVHVKSVEIDNRENPMMEIEPDKAATIIEQIIEVNNDK